MAPPNSNDSNIKDYWSDNKYNNKKLEILREFPKCNTETRSEQMVLEKWLWYDLLNSELPQTFNL